MKILCPAFALLLLWQQTVTAQTSPPEKYYKHGVVVCAKSEAAQVGVAILKKGGNAVDAAVAVQFALAVVYPVAGNIGGGGFMVYRSSKGKTATLDYREKAPKRASRDMYLDSAGNPVSRLSIFGDLAVGVPGSVAGMVQAHARYGKLSWRKLIQPAVDLAEKGYLLTARQAADFNRNKATFIKYNPMGAAIVKDADWKEGDIFTQPELAHTLKLIRDHGRAGFYKGAVADSIVAEMQRGKGIITKSDLRNYRAVWRKPVQAKYKGYGIVTMPPPSSGGICLVQLLHSVAPYPLSRWGFNADSTVQLMVEAERRVYADRSKYLGDPDFYSVPRKSLLSASYQKQRMRSFTWDKATPSSEVGPGTIPGREHEETTHFSIVDRHGNAVSVTTTLNNSYGSFVFVKGAGFLLNDEMDDFSAKAGSPNMYGLIGGKANAIAPNKRMLSAMTPTIITKKGKLYMIVGTPGGSTIITSVFQTILNVIDFKKPIQEAVTIPRFHSQWLPDQVDIEKNALSDQTTQILSSKGYVIKPRGAIGRVDAILKTKKGYQGGADPRGEDAAVGY
jgi:gamma-glutamyltranspeptidase / glutathione hydrolase